MLSYVVPNPTKGSSDGNNSQTSSLQRNLSLNLSPQYQQLTTQPSIKINNTYANATKKSQEVDAMLANVVNDIVITSESCDEHTYLLAGGAPHQTIRHQSNNNYTLHGRTEAEDDALSDDAIINAEASEITVTVDADASDMQLFHQTKRLKFSKLGTKSVGLKRVSFGSSKGSMVETLVFETPTPLSEHVEPVFGFDSDVKSKIPINCSTSSKINMDDSGIEVQEESERSIVRVSIYHCNQPQQICAPEYLQKFDDNIDNLLNSYNCNIDNMTTASTIPGYDRQQSTDSGWDNPFRPGGDLSREADEIVNMIRGGKPITPTEDQPISNGNAPKEENCNGTIENVTKTIITQNQATQNGTNSHRVQVTPKSPDSKGVTSLAQVSKQVAPGPISASHVVIDERKSKDKGCCVIQ